jgi:peptidoglycan-associated lipoprotein
MKKVYSKIGSIVLVAVASLFISGCSNKADVGYDVTNKDVKVQEKLDSIKTVSSTSMNTNKVKEDNKKSSYINTVTSNVNGKNIVLSSVHFAFDKFTLSDEMRIITKNNYKSINPLILKNKNLKIKLEGNCDEWGTDEYNYALGLKRAKVAKDALVNDGIDSSRIILVTFGESNPLCSNKTEQCWKRNRRTDYRLLP